MRRKVGSLRSRQVWCDKHSWQYVTQETIAKAKKTVKKMQAEGQLDFDDIPRF
jgi:hypothetical protein